GQRTRRHRVVAGQPSARAPTAAGRDRWIAHATVQGAPAALRGAPAAGVHAGAGSAVSARPAGDSRSGSCRSGRPPRSDAAVGAYIDGASRTAASRASTGSNTTGAGDRARQRRVAAFASASPCGAVVARGRDGAGRRLRKRDGASAGGAHSP